MGERLSSKKKEVCPHESYSRDLPAELPTDLAAVISSYLPARCRRGPGGSCLPPIPPCYLDETKYDQTECNEYDDCRWDEEDERCRIRQGSLDDLDKYECMTDIFPQQCSERFISLSFSSKSRLVQIELGWKINVVPLVVNPEGIICSIE